MSFFTVFVACADAATGNILVVPDDDREEAHVTNEDKEAMAIARLLKKDIVACGGGHCLLLNGEEIMDNDNDNNNDNNDQNIIKNGTHPNFAFKMEENVTYAVWTRAGPALERAFAESKCALILELNNQSGSAIGLVPYCRPLRDMLMSHPNNNNNNNLGNNQRVIYTKKATTTKDEKFDVRPRSWVFLGLDRQQQQSDQQLKGDETAYLDLLRELVSLGTNGNNNNYNKNRKNRTGIPTTSVFGRQIRFDISEGKVPLVTTKRVNFAHALEELLWFCRGETDTRVLSDRGVSIWKGNSSREFLDSVGLAGYQEGDIGPGYGFQWRRAGAQYRGPAPGVDYGNGPEDGADQLAYVENLLKTDPFSRRILLSAWAPADLPKMALPPCHVMAQWYVEEGAAGLELSCMLTMRSCDTFLGLPWNIASYATLTHLLAKRCGMADTRELVVSIGDCHLYENCLEQAREQLARRPLPVPRIWMSDEAATKPWEELSQRDVELHGYYPHPRIRAEMAV
jgi:thymidylate synthase